jgi:hypothetical protein
LITCHDTPPFKSRHHPNSRIAPAMFVRRHNDLANILSGANHLLRAFRAVWNFVRRTHDLPESPTNVIEWFDEEQDGHIISDLIAQSRQVDDILNLIHRTFYEIILYTGLRKSEAPVIPPESNWLRK